MNILFLTLSNIKSIESIELQGIYTDLLREFAKNKHNIFIISPIERRLNQKTELIVNGNIHILRVEIGNITKTSFLEKTISMFLIEKQYVKALKNNFNTTKFDLVLYSTPPITFEKSVRYIKKRDNAYSYLLLKDIFPQNAVDLKLFSELNPIYYYFRMKEISLYKISDYIGCMSLANQEYILKHNKFLTSKKVELCPNSIEPKNFIYDKNDILKTRNEYGIPNDKIIFLYGGNLGKPQGIDFLIQCLHSNKDNDNVFFVIAGSGTEYEKINRFIKNGNLTNAKLFSQIPRVDYELLVNSCDVGLIFLDYRFTIPNFPSRLLSYMQSSIPVLAATDKNTDIGGIIELGNFGYWCESTDVIEFNRLLIKLQDEKIRKQLGNNGRSYLEENYTVKRTYNIIMRNFIKKDNDNYV